ncbi:MAG: DUF1361 domain-containing protein [Patescibacteria group bacterium]
MGLAFLVSRVVITGDYEYWFLAWNVFLAFIPWLISAWLLAKKTLGASKWIWLICWLLFLPNTFYLATDVIHLAYIQSSATENAATFLSDPDVSIVLLDSVIVLLGAWVGWFLGVASLRHIHKTLSTRFSRVKTAVIIGLITLASSYAIYLGRILRLNSWELATNPLSLVDEIVGSISDQRAFGITMLFFVMISIVYWSVDILLFSGERPKAQRSTAKK